MNRITRIVPDQVSRNTLVWVLVAQAVSIVPLLAKLPIWVALVWLSALLWRVQIFRGRIGFPNAWVKVVLGGLCVGLILASYAGVAGVEPMVGFLVCSFTLKLIEMHTRKDALIILFIGFIAIAAQFLFAQDILAAAYGILSFWVLISAWRAVLGRRDLPWRHQLQQSALGLGQSLPLLMVMFLIMPRVGPLWSVPLPQGQGKTGFSESLELGDISELVKSQELAFHAEFEGPPPDPQSLYWRGLVLDRFDGREWQAGNHWLLSKLNAVDRDQMDDLQTYTIILEPHQQQWLFSLGYPLEAESPQVEIRRVRSGLLLSTKPVVQRIQYRVVSMPGLLDEAATVPRDLRGQLEFPGRYNPRTQALAQNWLARGLAADEIVEQALSLYREQFFYTLRPSPLGTDSIDDFLFETKEGFCEHFAASFVMLMRAANIPARVVVGYQGGAINPKGFITVRQADAHAWSEVWLPGQGWISVDPTAVVAPNRVRLGVAGALGEADRELLHAGRWFSGLRNRWETMGYSWQRWVLNYDNDKKDAFLTRWLGGAGPWRIGLVFVGICALTVLVVAAVFLWRQRAKPPPEEERMVRSVIGRLTAMGYPRQPEETLRHYFQRVALEKPALLGPLSRIADAYYNVKYRHPGEDLTPLRRAITSLQC